MWSRAHQQRESRDEYEHDTRLNFSLGLREGKEKNSQSHKDGHKGKEKVAYNNISTTLGPFTTFTLFFFSFLISSSLLEIVFIYVTAMLAFWLHKITEVLQHTPILIENNHSMHIFLSMACTHQFSCMYVNTGAKYYLMILLKHNTKHSWGTSSAMNVLFTQQEVTTRLLYGGFLRHSFTADFTTGRLFVAEQTGRLRRI